MCEQIVGEKNKNLNKMLWQVYCAVLLLVNAHKQPLIKGRDMRDSCKFPSTIKICLDEDKIISVLENMTGYDWDVDIEDGEYKFTGYVPGTCEHTPAVYYDSNMEGHPEEIDTKVFFNELTLIKQIVPVVVTDVNESAPEEE